jgi:hypothetical protein
MAYKKRYFFDENLVRFLNTISNLMNQILFVLSLSSSPATVLHPGGEHPGIRIQFASFGSGSGRLINIGFEKSSCAAKKDCS